ncbi:MAG: hypothetical protein DME25_08630, partial [Verrucomicrobia bacterium]
MLMVELSRSERFQLVDREKVQSVLNELNVSASGLSSRNTVAKLGQVLSCDWLVSGSFVQTSKGTQVWAKIIDVRSGVVLDMDALPYESGNLPGTVERIHSFLAKAGPRPRGRQFITLGRFVDRRPWLSASREDWSRRLVATIEKRFYSEGYGVVEMEAVTPIFEERRLEAAIGQTEDRVRLQPAFWLVDGGCKWIEGNPAKLEVGLRVQRVGGPEQMFRFTASPGEGVEEALLETLRTALANTNTVASENSAKAEADVLTSRGMELATRRSPFQEEVQPSTGNQLETLKRLEDQRKSFPENRRMALATYERTVLLDPNNLEAKTMLGYALLGDLDPANRERGKELLRQVVASKDLKYADRAQKLLDNAPMYAAYADRGAQPVVPSADREGLEKIVAANPSDLDAKYKLGALLLFSNSGTERGRGAELLHEVIAGAPTELAELARKKLPGWANLRATELKAKYDVGSRLITSEAVPDRERGAKLLSEVAAGEEKDLAELAQRLLPPAGATVATYHPQPIQTTGFAQYEPTVLGQTPAMTAAAFAPPSSVLVAAGAALYRYAPGRPKLERMELAHLLQHPITAIKADRKSIWLGTDGGGVVQLSPAGEFRRVFSTNDGLLMPSIRALALFEGQLWIGFGSGSCGGIGYLDVTTTQYVGLTSVASMQSGSERPDQPPACGVSGIKTAHEKTLWVGTSCSLKRFDIQTGKWSTALPFAPLGLSVEETFVSVGAPTGGVLVCQLPGNNWQAISLSKKPDQNLVSTLMNEGQRIWLGSEHMLRHLDVPAQMVIGGARFDAGLVRWIYPEESFVWFVA